MRLPLLALVLPLLAAIPALGEGSFNRLPSPPKPAPAAETAPEVSPAPAAPQVAAPAAEPSPAVAPAPAAPEEASEEEAPLGEPTHGEVCVYGPEGVVYGPRGRDCGDEVPAPSAAAEGRQGRCIFGAGGRVVYAPPGVDCAGTLQDSTPEASRRRPRARRLRY